MFGWPSGKVGSHKKENLTMRNSRLKRVSLFGKFNVSDSLSDSVSVLVMASVLVDWVVVGSLTLFLFCFHWEGWV